MKPVLGVVVDWAYKPLVLYNANDEEVQSIVEHQVFGHAGASLSLWDRAQVGFSLPLAIVNSGESGTETNSSFSTNDGASVGDARLGGDFRFLGEPDGPVRMALGLAVHLPTGSEEALTGDGGVRIVPRVTLAGDAGQLAWSGQLNANVRTETEEVANAPVGSEMGFEGGVGVKLVDDKLLLGPEVYGATTVSDGGAFKKKSTALELVVGGHYDLSEEWRAGLGVGPGLTRGYGTPQLRVLASIEWRASKDEAPPPPPPKEPEDRDGDGIIDDQDACPDTPGVENDDPEKHGCPLPGDRDNDGIKDDVDACPDTAGEANDDPKKHGCPPADRDGDKVLDDVDACPDEPGVPTEVPTTNGCPPPKDTDGDGILDENDACVDQPGEKSEDPKKHGCPKAKIEKGQIKILEQVKFATASAKILPESDSILQAVKKILDDEPDILLISVEGHTDNRGSRPYNRWLSDKRAKAVVKWLVDAGIEKSRLKGSGFGPDKPIDSNDTDEGRQNNRRVEFHIEKVKEGSNLKVEPRK